MIFILSFLLLVILLIVGVPVVFSFGTCAVILAYAFDISATTVFPTMYDKLSSVVLLCIPMFIMAGGIMEKGKIGGALIGFVEMFVGRVKGSLAIVATVTSAVFGSISGSGAATLSCIGSIMFPKMRESNYDMGKAAAIICCSAPLGLLIPPSSAQIIIAWMGNLSVLACFLSTLIPGIILTVLICITNYFMLRKDAAIIEIAKRAKSQRLSFKKDVVPRTRYALPALFMPFLILGGIYGGIMTPTEAAGLAVFYAIPVAIWVYKGTTVREIRTVLVSTAVSTGVLMVMLGVMMVISQILVMQNIPSTVLSLMSSISENPKVILLLINIFLVLMGMIMDDCSGVMLASTLLLPMVNELGISPYTMSAIIGVNLGMGNITPPTAPFLYMASGIAKVDSMKMLAHCFKIIVFAYIPTLILTTYVPVITTFLPGLVLR